MKNKILTGLALLVASCATAQTQIDYQNFKELKCTAKRTDGLYCKHQPSMIVGYERRF